MDLHHEFEVATPIDRAWAVLTDLERVAPCMPGAELQEVDGDDYKGVVKVKVGPITTQYKGVARFLERDEAQHKAVLRAEGRETRGQGNASATITAVLSSAGDGTKVEIDTDLAISGKVAQFGRGVLSDITAKLLTQFVDELEKNVLNDDAGSASDGAATASSDGAPASATDATSSPRTPAAEPEPLNLVRTVVGPVAKRLLIVAPLALLSAIGVFLARLVRGKRRRKAAD